MSAQTGIFKFDPRSQVDRSELMSLAHGIDRIGPDGGSEYVNSNLGMAYRAFHTTPESHFESQPLVQKSCILTWDGRLDNREELRAKVTRKYEGTPTDLDLVFAAYDDWGTECFTELEGDWALALWDTAKQQLVLARDFIGVRRLFYRLDEDGIAWCSSLEPLVLQSRASLHLDLDYLAGCLYPRPPIETSPYREIRAVLPSHFLTVQSGGKLATKRYWALNPHDRIRYSSDSDYEHHFRDVFRSSVERRLRAGHTVLAELSGGLDSSSIVCMADDIRRELPGVPIETLSFYDTDEPSGDERPYFSLVEQRRGRTGHRISKSEFARETRDGAFEPLPDGCFAASPGYFTQSLRWASLIDRIQRKAGARVVLSGLGGDEVLGGVQFEAPELADYLIEGKLISVVRSLYRWSLARKKTVFELLNDAMQLLEAARSPDSLTATKDKPFSWACLKPLARHSNLATFANWRQLSPTQVTMEWIRYNLASQLACTDPPLVGCQEKRYPFLDRALFVFLASIPRTQIVQAGHRRHLMRRALRSVVPDGVLFRKTKWFGSRSVMATIGDQASDMDNLFDGKWISDGIVVNADLVEISLRAIQQGMSGEAMQLISAVAVEQWLRSQLAHGHIDLASAFASGASARENAEPISKALVAHREN